MKKSICIGLSFIILSMLLPVKFSRENVRNTKEYYTAFCVSEGSTDAGTWIVYGNQNGEWEEKDCMGVYFVGKNPKDILSFDICNNYTHFIIYGTLEQENDGFYTLHSEKWDILGEIHRGDDSFRIPFGHFITIYDLKWFDFLLSDMG